MIVVGSVRKMQDAEKVLLTVKIYNFVIEVR